MDAIVRTFKRYRRINNADSTNINWVMDWRKTLIHTSNTYTYTSIGQQQRMIKNYRGQYVPKVQ